MLIELVRIDILTALLLLKHSLSIAEIYQTEKVSFYFSSVKYLCISPWYFLFVLSLEIVSKLEGKVIILLIFFVSISRK